MGSDRKIDSKTYKAQWHWVSHLLSKIVSKAVASGMWITRPDFKWGIVLLCTERCCCRYTTTNIQEMKKKLFCNNNRIKYM